LIPVKCGLLSLRPIDQFLDAIKESLIGESGRDAVEMLNLAVEFDALVTHSIPPFFRPGETTSSCRFTTTERQFSFNAPRSFGSGFNEAMSHQCRANHRHRSRSQTSSICAATATPRSRSPPCCMHRPMSASLIGRLRSSAFRLSTTAMSM
jgi:hypothetical protein